VKKTTKQANVSQRNSTIILMACSGLYMSTMAFALICCILIILSEPPVCTYFFSAETQFYVLPLSNLSMLTNYSFGFILYCVTWQKFRDGLKDLTRKLLFKKTSKKHPVHKKVTRKLTAETQFSGDGSNQGSVKMINRQPDPLNTTKPVLAITKFSEDSTDVSTVPGSN
jgi:hypothetical protein